MSRRTRSGRTRGRPRHPDILTPREWEVLELVRERLTNEQIAERLGITLDGAKYHVSSILGKLGVATREEAALWRPPEHRPSWTRAALSLPVAARIAGALAIATGAAGIGLLVWGVVQTGGPANEQAAVGRDLPKPDASPTLTRDRALLMAAQHIGGDVTDIQGGLTTWAAAKATLGDAGFGAGEPAASAPAWLFRFRGMFTQFSGGSSGGRGTPVQPTVSCREITVLLPDEPTPSGPSSSASSQPSTGPCQTRAPLSRDIALVLASHAVSWLDPPEAAAGLTTYGQAIAVVSDPGLTLRAVPAATGGMDDRVWLVTLAGTFYEGEGSSPPGGTPRPTTIVTCGTAYVIVDASTTETQMYMRAPSSCP